MRQQNAVQHSIEKYRPCLERLAQDDQSVVVEIPQLTKDEQCGKCGREIRVGKNVVLAYCRECSAGLGVKK